MRLYSLEGHHLISDNPRVSSSFSSTISFGSLSIGAQAYRLNQRLITSIWWSYKADHGMSQSIVEDLNAEAKLFPLRAFTQSVSLLRFKHTDKKLQFISEERKKWNQDYLATFNVHLPEDRVIQTHQNYGFSLWEAYSCQLSNFRQKEFGLEIFNLDYMTGNSKGYGFISYDNFDSSDAGKDERHGSAADVRPPTVPPPMIVASGVFLFDMLSIKKTGSGGLLKNEKELRFVKIDRFALPGPNWFSFLKLSGSWMIGSIGWTWTWTLIFL
ncbi:unnamed protein product [Rhizophagus irregularis]|nr:unnamed protein product [Rhizophagus irregularis]